MFEGRRRRVPAGHAPLLGPRLVRSGGGALLPLRGVEATLRVAAASLSGGRARTSSEITAPALEIVRTWRGARARRDARRFCYFVELHVLERLCRRRPASGRRPRFFRCSPQVDHRKERSGRGALALPPARQERSSAGRPPPKERTRSGRGCGLSRAPYAAWPEDGRLFFVSAELTAPDPPPPPEAELFALRKPARTSRDFRGQVAHLAQSVDGSGTEPLRVSEADRLLS